MDLKKDNFSLFIQKRNNERKKKNLTHLLNTDNQLGNYSSPRDDCNNNYEYNFNRSKEIELKLEFAFKESFLPRFEQIVEHLRNRKDDIFDDIDFDDMINSKTNEFKKKLNLNFVNRNDELDSISVVSSVKRQSANDTECIKNYDFFFKELLFSVGQFLNIVDKSVNQHILEKAAVFFLWTLYDASILNNLTNHNSNPTSFIDMPTFCSNYPIFEYIFCLNGLNNQILEKICSISVELLKSMDINFLNIIFYYSSMIRKAAQDVEIQAHPDQDWFNLLEQNLFKNGIVLDYIDLFEANRFSSSDEILKQSNKLSDLEIFKPNDINSEFILQNLFSKGNK